MTSPRRAASLPVSFFARPADVVAAELLGAVVVSTIGGVRTAGRIIETEAYLGGDDPASHANGFRCTERNAAIFGPPATWYVYLSYGMHWCANLVCGVPGHGSAVLLRALQPIEGLDTMRARRGAVAARPQSGTRALCSGPGKLCQALGVTRSLDGLMIADAPVIVVPGELDANTIVEITPRIGISKAVDWPLRFVATHKRPAG